MRRLTRMGKNWNDRQRAIEGKWFANPERIDRKSICVAIGKWPSYAFSYCFLCADFCTACSCYDGILHVCKVKASCDDDKYCGSLSFFSSLLFATPVFYAPILYAPQKLLFFFFLVVILLDISHIHSPTKTSNEFR